MDGYKLSRENLSDSGISFQHYQFLTSLGNFDGHLWVKIFINLKINKIKLILIKIVNLNFTKISLNFN